MYSLALFAENRAANFKSLGNGFNWLDFGC